MTLAATMERIAGTFRSGTWLSRTLTALRPHWPLLAILAFAAWFLSPIIRSPFNGDDYFLSFIGGYMRSQDLSLWKITRREINAFMMGGRLFPAHLAVAYLTYFIFADRIAYKVFVVCMVLVNLVLFYAVQRRWKVDRSVAQLGALLAVLLMQMRIFHDPLLAYTGQLQLIVSQLLVGILCLQQYLRSNRPAWLGASVLCYAFSLLTYEINYAFILIYFIVAFVHWRRWKPVFSTVLPYAIVAAVIVAYTAGLRYHGGGNPDYKVNLDPVKILETAARQVFAALPATYATMSIHTLEHFRLARLLTRLDNWSIFAACGLLAAGLLRTAFKQRSTAQQPPAGLFSGALAIWILPAIPIAVSTRYQREILTGLAYLPVYVQYFGVAMLGVWSVLWLRHKYPGHMRPATAALAVLCAGTAMITYDMNREVVDIYRKDWHVVDRDNVEAALRHGLLELVPPKATLLVSTSHDWLKRGWPGAPSAFFSQHANRPMDVVNSDTGAEQLPLAEQLQRSPRPTFAFCGHGEDGHSGYAIVSCISPNADFNLDLDCDCQEESQFATRSFRIFVRGQRYLKQIENSQVIGLDSLPGADSLLVIGSQLQLVRKGRGWAIYEGSFPQDANVATLALQQEPAALTARMPAPTLKAPRVD